MAIRNNEEPADRGHPPAPPHDVTRVRDGPASVFPEPTDRPPVVIVGIDDERGVHVARTMDRHGIGVIGIAKRRNSVGSRSRAFRRIIVVDTDSEKLIDELVELAAEFAGKAVLIPCFDSAVSVISEHRNRLADSYLFALPDDETVRLIKDKIRFYEYAEEHGFEIPKTAILRGKDEIGAAAQEMRFPCILKPPDSKSPNWMRHTHTKAFEVNDVAECEVLYDRHKEATDVFVLQEMVRGGDDAIYTCYGYYDAATEPLIEFTSRKLRQWPIRSGVGCLAEEIPQEVVRETANRLLKPLRFHGLCSLEMKRDSEDGKFYIIEANIGRPTGRAAHVEGCGVEMMFTLYCDLVGLPLPDERFQPFEGRKWINIRSDMLAAISYWRLGELTLPNWYRSIRGVSSFALFSWHDPRPFVAEIRRTIWRGALRRTIWRGARHVVRRDS